MERTRAIPSVETAQDITRSWAGTASNGSANLTVIGTSGPCGQRDYPAGPLGSRWSRGMPGRVRGHAAAARIAKCAAGRTFCRVYPQFQQAINGPNRQGRAAFVIIICKINGLVGFRAARRQRLFRTASSRTRLLQVIYKSFQSRPFVQRVKLAVLERVRDHTLDEVTETGAS